MMLLKVLFTKSWLVFVIVIAAAGIGGGAYAAWTASLHVEGTIQTGNVDVVWDMQDDIETVGILNPATGQLVDSPIPAGKDVADCLSSLQPGQTARTVDFTVRNAYPSYTCTIILGGIVNGSVPVHVSNIKVTATDRLTGADILNTEVNVNVLLTRKFADETSPTGFVCDRESPVVINTQLHRGDRFCAIISVHATMAAQQNHDYLGGVWIDMIQWNFAGSQPAVTLPVFNVSGAGVSLAQANSIATAFSIPANQFQFENGVARFIDPATFQAIPMTQVALTEDVLSQTEQDDEGTEIEGLALNFDAIKRMVAFDGKLALANAQEGLGAGQAIPRFGLPAIQNTMFEAVGVQGEQLAKVAIDTNIAYPMAMRSLPMIGPGAQVNVTFGPNGDVTQLYHSVLNLTQGPEMEIISMGLAAEQCQQLYPGLGADIKPTMAYYAPPLSLGPQLILPHYDCQGTVPQGESSLNVLQQLVPAISDPKFVPQIAMTSSFDGRLVSASAVVTGGRAPYSYSWTSVLADLSQTPEDASSVQYTPTGRAAAALQVQLQPSDNLRLVVVDANGIMAVASQNIPLGIDEQAAVSLGTYGVVSAGGSKLARPLNAGGTIDFGIERAVSDMCSNNVNRYGNTMDNKAFKRFHWTGTNAWERDFKTKTTSSSHELMVDNVDEAFYCGHGWSGGFTFEGNSDDGSIVPADPLGSIGGDWGDGDLEWLALLSCQVLKLNDGQALWQRWGPAFDGLHLLLGFDTNAYDWSNFGKRFAEYQTGQGRPLLPVRAAWFQAAAEEQPNNVRSVVMGVVGPNGWSNYNDHFWGQGKSTGPDLRGSNIQGFWWAWRTN